jgi:hypothetical protein
MGGLTDVFDVRVLHDVFVHCERGDPEEYTCNHHGDDTGNPS